MALLLKLAIITDQRAPCGSPLSKKVVLSVFEAVEFEGCIVVVGAVEDEVDGADVDVVDAEVVDVETVEVVGRDVDVVGCAKVAETLPPAGTFPEDGDGTYVDPPTETMDMLNARTPAVDCIVMLPGAVPAKAAPATETLHCEPCGSPDSENTVLTVAGTEVVVDDDAEDAVELIAMLEFVDWNESRA